MTCDAMTNLLWERCEACDAVIKDIGFKLLSEEGKEYLRVQEDVLTACNILRAHHGMDYQQVLNIQNLLLMDPDKIVPAFIYRQGTVPNILQHEVCCHSCCRKCRNKLCFGITQEEEIITHVFILNSTRRRLKIKGKAIHFQIWYISFLQFYTATLVDPMLLKVLTDERKKESKY